MRLRLRSVTLFLLLVGCAVTHAGTTRGATNAAASAQDYPAKPVQIIEPFGAGGGPDLLARALAPKLSELWGQLVTVDNYPGAGATAAPARVAKSPADGYTLLINSSAQAYSAAISKNLPYDPLKDFIPIASLTNQPYVLVAGNPAGITTVHELIAAAKAKPGELKFGYTGTGTGTHLAISKFNLEAGIMPTDVPPQTTDAISDGVTATIDGRITYMIAPISITLPPIRGGTVPAGWNHCETLDIASGGAGDR
jgi:tripartite-type tricarboxylate transporter receptor subunit TctC